MNYVDIIIAIPLLWGLYKGFTKGLIIEASSIVALGLAIWAGIKFSDFLANYIQANWGWETKYLSIVSFAIIFLGILIGMFLLAKFLERIVEAVSLGFVNKIAGGIFGMLKFGLISSMFIFIFNAITLSFVAEPLPVTEKSLLYKPVGKIAPLIIPGLRNSKMGEMIKIPFMDNKPTSD